jgi:hypothetical protein
VRYEGFEGCDADTDDGCVHFDSRPDEQLVRCPCVRFVRLTWFQPYVKKVRSKGRNLQLMSGEFITTTMALRRIIDMMHTLDFALEI